MDSLEELSLAELADVAGGLLSPDTLSMAYRSLGKMGVLAPAPESALGRAGLWQPNPYLESVRNAVTTQFAQPQNASSSTG